MPNEIPHPSAARLLEAADRFGDRSPTEIARKMNVSVQKVFNWLSRGVSKEGALQAQATYKVDANWILGLAEIGHLVVRETGMKYLAKPETPQVSPYGDESTYLGAPPLGRIAIRGNADVNKDGFWFELDDSTVAESFAYPTTDPDAYAVRIKGDHYDPAIESDDCVLIEPNFPLRLDGRVLVKLKDGRSSIQRLRVYDDKSYKFQSITNASLRVTVQNVDVEYVHFVRGNLSLHGIEVSS
jgi:SOS-response transcriptional repressor LexA